MREKCDVVNCGSEVEKTIAFALQFGSMRLPAMANVCATCGSKAESLKRWHTAKGDGPSINFQKLFGKNSTFISVGPLIEDE